MAQDNTPAVVMYKGAQEDGYSIPFDKGYYGEVKVAFVRRGLTDYEYMPTTYTVDGALYAWEISTGVYYYTKSASPAVDATVYNSSNQEISGVKVVSTQNASASFSDGKMGVRSNKKDIHSHALLFWTGEPLGDDDWICIVRETVKKQPYSYPNNQKHIESALDNLSRQIQELKAQSDVSLKVDPTFVQDPAKMNPIDWLNTIVRSTDTTARGLRYRNFWLEYSTDDPNKVESDKSWTKLLNTTNITSVREWYDEDNKVYIPQYSMDGGLTWKTLGAVHLIEDVQEQIDELKENVYTKTQVDGKFSATNAAVDANADAIQKTREDYINADSEIHQILNNHASELTTLRGNQASLGDQVAGIEEKIPGDASATNQLATKADLKGIGGDFVKKSGDTMTGILTIQAEEDYDPSTPPVGGLSFKSNASPDGFTNRMRQVGNGFVAIEYLLNGKQYSNLVFGDQQIYIDNTENGTGNPVSLGTSNNPWDNVYAKKLNNGADISVPTLGGTLARIEDLIDLRADINEADSELQTQITAQAAEIATKQDQLTAGDNIIISGNIISATGAGGGVGFDVIVVQELPESGEKGIIYLVPKDSAAPDVYDEYVWVSTTSTFELIGSTKVDLTGYVKNTDYATSTVGGVIKANSIFGCKMANGNFVPDMASLATYTAKGENFWVGKGTLENIKNDYVKRGITENTIVLTNAEQTAAQNWLGVGSGLPDQTDNAGKFLTTNGSEVSWGNTLPYTEYSSDSIVAGFTKSGYMYKTTAFGKNITLTNHPSTSTAFGSKLRLGNGTIVFGVDITAGGTDNVVIGSAQLSADVSSCIVIGKRSPDVSFGESKSVIFATYDNDYKLLDLTDGTIPAERIGNLDFGTMD